METVRKPFQGVLNIVRFNWPFYVMAFVFVLALIILSFFTKFQLCFILGAFLFTLPITLSLLVSLYVYDLSGLYFLIWLPKNDPGKKLLNINAGFDETSALLQHGYKNSELVVFDFYDPLKHTEASIERARNAYPPYEGTLRITTSSIPLENESTDTVYLIFAAHEIRNDEERIIFFKELHRILKPNGQIIIAEHLRDLPNFIAYTIGFFHFLPLSSWKKTFAGSGFKISEHKKHTPFINIFVLNKNGYSL